MSTVEEELIFALNEDIKAKTVSISEDAEHVVEIQRLYGRGFPYSTSQETIKILSFDDEISYLLRNVKSLLESDTGKIIMISDSDLSFALIFTYDSLSKNAEELLHLPTA